MKSYLDLLTDVITTGVRKPTRPGIDALSVFGRSLRFDLRAGFPLLTTKRVFFKGVAAELLWFLRAETNIAPLHAAGVHIWDEWADPQGELGPIYGKQWRSWPMADGSCVDQIDRAVQALRKNPDDRRLLVSAWNVGQLDQMALPPCHLLFQFYSQSTSSIQEPRLLSCQVYQRSADLFLGVPFNIASYALLVHLMAAVTDHTPHELVWVGGDVHLYENHLGQVKQQLLREPRPLPRLEVLASRHRPEDFGLEDFKLVGYDPHPAIAADVAV